MIYDLQGARKNKDSKGFTLNFQLKVQRKYYTFTELFKSAIGYGPKIGYDSLHPINFLRKIDKTVTNYTESLKIRDHLKIKFYNKIFQKQGEDIKNVFHDEVSLEKNITLFEDPEKFDLNLEYSSTYRNYRELRYDFSIGATNYDPKIVKEISFLEEALKDPKKYFMDLEKESNAVVNKNETIIKMKEKYEELAKKVPSTLVKFGNNISSFDSNRIYGSIMVYSMKKENIDGFESEILEIIDENTEKKITRGYISDLIHEETFLTLNPLVELQLHKKHARTPHPKRFHALYIFHQCHYEHTYLIQS